MARKGASKLETEETGKGTTTTLERHHLKRKPRTKHETQTTIQNKTYLRDRNRPQDVFLVAEPKTAVAVVSPDVHDTVGRE